MPWIDADRGSMWVREHAEDDEVGTDLSRVKQDHLRDPGDTLFELVGLATEGMVVLDDDEVRSLLGPAVEFLGLAGGNLTADPVVGSIAIEADERDLPTWVPRAIELSYDLIVTWWRSSPSALLNCEVCGMTILGSRRERACIRSSPARAPRDFSIGKGLPAFHKNNGCEGRMTPLEMPWSTKRPTARKVKL